MARVLIVERSSTQRGILRGYVEERGHEVVEAQSAAEARHEMSTSEPDAVLLAWELADEPAPFLLRLWSMHEKLKWVPVIVVTSHAKPEMIEEALKLGAVDFIRKPLQEIELMARLKAALRTRELQQQLIHVAQRDALTGLFNRRRFMERLATEWARARRYKKVASVAIIDVDRFKSVNDTLGHEAGDKVLQQLARILEAGVRNVDTAARYGGEEFVLLLPETPIDGAYICAERLRRTAEQATWLEGKLHVTFSCGVCELLLDQSSPEVSLKHADDALYQAKEGGRNQVVIAEATKELYRKLSTTADDLAAQIAAATK
jgi:diguanylate cyclase (GGDEF)-like protein